jgi:hypothetical protein
MTESRTIEANPTRAAEEPAVIEIERVGRSHGASFVAADPEYDTGRLDAVAGSEFVDDRIRLRE